MRHSERHRDSELLKSFCSDIQASRHGSHLEHQLTSPPKPQDGLSQNLTGSNNVSENLSSNNQGRFLFLVDFEKLMLASVRLSMHRLGKKIRVLAYYARIFLPNIGEIINKYWGLLALPEKQSVKYVFQHKPIWAFKRPQNLGVILNHTKMNFIQNPTGSVSSCKNRRCTHCKTINDTDNFSSTRTSEIFCINRILTVHLKVLIV